MRVYLALPGEQGLRHDLVLLAIKPRECGGEQHPLPTGRPASPRQGNRPVPQTHRDCPTARNTTEGIWPHSTEKIPPSDPLACQPRSSTSEGVAPVSETFRSCRRIKNAIRSASGDKKGSPAFGSRYRYPFHPDRSEPSGSRIHPHAGSFPGGNRRDPGRCFGHGKLRPGRIEDCESTTTKTSPIGPQSPFGLLRSPY